jgi:hypothetical protein
MELKTITKTRFIIIAAIFNFLFSLGNLSYSQNVGFNTTGSLPNPSALVDIDASPLNNKGLLIPRVSLTQTSSNTPIGAAIATSLLVYNTATINDVIPGYYYWDGATWVRLSTGAAGPTGPTGANGIDGVTGPQGPAGVNGINGVTGSQGPAGTNGLNGAAGPTGANGTNGIDGVTGATGPAGVAGTNGINGVTGPAGTNGLNGATGATGPAGVAGINGTNGLNGATGSTGPIGLTGIPGTNGSNGTNGANGVTGPIGPTGVAGTNGSNGTNGTNGLNGSTGPTGVAGSNGTNGTNGTNGVTGPTGVAGANGSNGTNGTNGLNGSTGPTGPAGIAGPNGSNGTNGTNGVTGPIGPTGVAGTNGSNGANGSNGTNGVTGPTGPTWTITSNNFNANGTQAIVTTIPSTIISTNAAWLVGGNNLAGTGILGTTSNQHVDLYSNNIVRGRLSNLGEFFIGTTATAMPGDLMNSVSNVTFPWAVNGYSTQNGSGVYGAVQSGATFFGGVQGEYNGTNSAGAGVRGIATYVSAKGIHGQEVTYTGWAGYFDGDVYCSGTYFGSDSTIKKNISKLNGSLNKILSISGYEYDFNTEKFKSYSLSPRHQYGVIAQEVEKVFPELVVEKTITSTNVSRSSKPSENQSMKIKTVNYNGLFPVLIEAIKEQQKMIVDLQIKNAEQEKINKDFQNQLDVLNSSLKK